MEKPYAQRRRKARSHSECQAKALATAEQPQRPRQRQRTWQEQQPLIQPAVNSSGTRGAKRQDRAVSAASTLATIAEMETEQQQSRLHVADARTAAQNSRQLALAPTKQLVATLRTEHGPTKRSKRSTTPASAQSKQQQPETRVVALGPGATSNEASHERDSAVWWSNGRFFSGK